MENLGKLLKTVRKSKSLTQQELGEILGSARQTIAKWEDGDIPQSAMPMICNFIAESFTECDQQRRHWQTEHDLVEHKLERLKIKIQAIIDT